MEHDSGRSRMGFAILASLLVHAAVIFLVPVASLNQVVIYPVEFGEIEQAFEAPRAGSPDGDASVAVQPEAQQPSEPASGAGTETQVTVKPSAKPAPRPASAPKPKQAVQPKPGSASGAPAKPAQAPAPVRTGAAQTKQAAAGSTGSQPVPSEQVPAVSSKPAITSAGATGAAAGASENVLTGKSDEVVPVPAATPSASAGAGVSASNAVPTTAAAGTNAGESARGEEAGGSTTAGGATAEGTGGSDAGGGPATPAKPKGEEFGTGRSLVLSGVPPVYPKDAQNEGAEGSVQLSVSVDALGNATKIAVTVGSGDARLDDAAIRAISRGWRFQAIGWPYELAVRVTFRKTTVEIAFGGVRVLGD
ncbi:MAG TPA: TonB family protein [Firmicutes bacterium]|nr:TonB family protein [Bacillota bacterium]